MKLKFALVLIFLGCFAVAWCIVGSPKKNDRETIYGKGLILCD